MKKSSKIFALLLILFVAALPLMLKAQGGFDEDTLDNPVPFDSGAIILGALIIAYGLKKANEKKRTDQF